jgi:hypothetical protein
MRWREVPLGSVCAIFDGPHATPQKSDEGPVQEKTQRLPHGPEAQFAGSGGLEKSASQARRSS